MIKILNCYAGIGGNRLLWKGDFKVVAIENNQVIANIYKDNFPEDDVIITDAHQYLLEHFEEYDFIWSSPPCPSHSRIRKELAVGRGQNKPIYPDMKLYEEILLLQNYYKGIYCIENVISFYEPLIKPQMVGSHYFWANFNIPNKKYGSSRIHHGNLEELEERKGFKLGDKLGENKIKILRNCVEPELGLDIFNAAFRRKQKTLF